MRIEVVHFDSPMLLAMLPPGAFIGLGMLLAAKYLIDNKMKQRAALKAEQESAAMPEGKTAQ
jgi:electron transport complex protein RnfE